MIFRTFLILLVVKAGASRMNKWSTAQETVLPNNPFDAIWNAPSEVCQTHFGVNLNLSAFDIVANKNVTFEGDEIVIYYKLGLFPFYAPGGVPENSGLPQVRIIYIVMFTFSIFCLLFDNINNICLQDSLNM